MNEGRSTVGVKGPKQPYLVQRAGGYFEYQLPISIKAVVVCNGLVPLLRNERDEWELPGGKLDVGESPIDCVKREVSEELGIDISVGPSIHNWVYEIFPDRHVFVVTYLAKAPDDAAPSYSHEHKELVLVSPADAMSFRMPEGYKESILRALDSGGFSVS